MTPQRRLLLAEVLFVMLALGLAILYGIQPARRDSWAQIQEKWRTLKYYWKGNSGTLLGPFDWSTVDLYGQARFGDELEFLGCDVAFSRDQAGTHVWQVTIWRALAPLEQDYALYMHFVQPGDEASFFSQADHLLGQQFPGGTISTSQWEPGTTMIDAVVLPDEVQSQEGTQIHIGVWLPESGVHLEPDTSLLEVDEHGRLVICQ